MSKQCGSCSKCCEGFLSESVFGNIFGKGKPCVFVDLTNKNCTIHEIAPKNPCGNYKCMWLKYEDVPLWMKPNVAPIIVSAETYNGRDFLFLNTFHKEYSAKYLSYVIRYADKNDLPLIYEIGPDQFVIHNHPDFFIDLFKNSNLFYWSNFNLTHEHERREGFVKYLPLIVK